MAEIEEKMVDTSTTDNLEDAYADAMPEEVPAAEDGGHLVPGDEGEHDAELHEQILTQETMWSGKIFDVERLEVKLPNGRHPRHGLPPHRGHSPRHSGCRSRCPGPRLRRSGHSSLQ